MTTDAAAGPAAREGRIRSIARSPVLFVFLLAPVLGELLSSSVPLPGFLLGWLPLAALYGCGALLVREAGARWGTGWAAILLLGAAYGIYEEGLVVRSFFDPEWQDLQALGVYGRAGGVNWLWAELLTLFHASVPIASTLLIAEVLFPGRKGRPWLRRRGLLWCGAVFGAWIPLGALAFMDAPGLHLGIAALVTAGLVVAGRLVRSPLLPPRPARVPAPRRFFLAGLIGNAVLFLGMYVPAGMHGEDPGAVPPAWVIGPGVAAVLVLVAWWVLARSGNAAAWDDRHRTALVGGLLVWMALLTTFAGGAFGPVVAAATVAGMWSVYRRARQGAEVEVPA